MEALYFLHDLGSVQYFTNNILKDFVILNPQWLIDAMACLISVKANIVQVNKLVTRIKTICCSNTVCFFQDGKFDRNDISQIWAKYPTQLHQWLLRLTEEFDLSFQLKDENINIVPCMLSDEEPTVCALFKKVHNNKSTQKKTVSSLR